MFAKRLKLSVLLVYSILLSTLSITSTWIALLQASSYRISITYHCADVWLHTITRYRYTASDFLIKLIFIAIALLCYAMGMAMLCYAIAMAMLLNYLLGAY